MKNNLILICATTPIFASLLVYVISLFSVLFAINSIINNDILSFLIMGITGGFLLIVSLALFYFRLLSDFIYPRLVTEMQIATSEKNQELLNNLATIGYIVKEQSPKYVLEMKAEINVLSLVLYLVLGILPGIIYLAVVQEVGNHSVTFELNGKVYKDVTIDKSRNKLIYNS